MTKILRFSFSGFSLLLQHCKSASNKAESSFDEVSDGEPIEVIEYNNPPAEGFDIEGSSPVAVIFADQVMNSMGGREKWDNTNVLYWNFFGARTLLWDKANNRVRVDIHLVTRCWSSTWMTTQVKCGNQEKKWCNPIRLRNIWTWPNVFGSMTLIGW